MHKNYGSNSSDLYNSGVDSRKNSGDYKPIKIDIQVEVKNEKNLKENSEHSNDILNGNSGHEDKQENVDMKSNGSYGKEFLLF